MNVYDFDNTLYDGESGLHLFLFYLKKRPWLVRYTPQVLQGVADYKRGKVTFDQAIGRVSGVLQPVLRGVEDYRADAREFWDKHEHRLRPFYRRLRRPDDLIISASPEQLLREACARMGVKHFIGSVINESTGLLEFACFRENKVKAFRERYPGQQIDSFYTDSMNDKPLMDIAKQVFMVNKRRIVQIK
jgi:phosphoserine phosphatase